VSGDARPVTVTILDKEYLVSCNSEEERRQLHVAVTFLNEQMLQLKSSGKVIGTERIAVMAALNLANELLACRDRNAHYTNSIDSTVRRLHSKIEQALAGDNRAGN
jgi:cell division protein ZapA